LEETSINQTDIQVDSEPLPDKQLQTGLTCLVALWFVIPGIQYFSTIQRTLLQVDGVTAFPGLATLDLTLAYYGLLALSVGYVIYAKLKSKTEVAKT